MVTANFLENIGNARMETKSDELEIRSLIKYFSLDIIAKVLFAIDVDSYKERDTDFVKHAVRMGDLNLFHAALAKILPKKIVNLLQLNAFDVVPMNKMGDYFKILLKQRKQDGVNYNDLSDVIQTAVEENKVSLTEDEVIGNILLAFFGKFLRKIFSFQRLCALNQSTKKLN